MTAMEYSHSSPKRGNFLAALEEALDRFQEKQQTKKKAAVDRVSEFLDDSAILSALDDNQLQKSRFKPLQLKEAKIGTTWNDVFRHVENFFVMECADVKTEGELEKKRYLCNLLTKTVERANRNVENPLLETKLLLQVLLKCLGHNLISSAFGSSFLKLLKQFLDSPTYVHQVDSKSWVVLIRIMVNLIRKGVLPVRKLHEVMIEVIRYGSNHPEAQYTLRHKVVDLYVEIIRNRKVFEANIVVILDAFILLSKAIALEARGILCAAGEMVISDVHQYVNTTAEKEKACKLFLLQMKLHMPLDCDMNNANTFYAEDVGKWRDQVVQIGRFCVDELENIANDYKRSKVTTKNIHIPKHLLALSVKCVYVSSSGRESDRFSTPLAKRLKSGLSLESVIDEIFSMPVDLGLVVWLKYLTAIFKEFPGTIRETVMCDNLISLGQKMTQTPYLGCPDVIEFLRSLIVCEKYLMMNHHKPPCMESWDIIWDTLSRFASPNEITENCVALIQDIMLTYHPNHVESLLHMYTGHVMPYNSLSLRLLANFLAICSLPSVADSESSSRLYRCSPRVLLLKWLIPSSALDIDLDVAPLIPRLIYALIVKNSDVTNILQDEKSNEDIVIQDFETVLAMLTFPTKIEKEAGNSIIGEISFEMINRSGDLCHEEVLKPFLEILESDAKDLPNIDYRKTDYLRKLMHVFLRLKTYLHLLSYATSFPASIFEEIQSSLRALFENVCTRFGPGLCQFFSEQQQFGGIYQAIKLFETVVEVRGFSDDIRELIRSKFFIPKDVLTHNVTIGYAKTKGEDDANSRDSDSDDNSRVCLYYPRKAFDEEPPSFTVKQLKSMITVESLKCLTHYAINVGGASSILSELLEALYGKSYFDWSLSYFELCSEFLLLCATAIPSSDEKFVGDIIRLLQVLCRRYYLNAYCVTQLWNIFTVLVPYWKQLNVDHKFMILVGNLSTVMESHGIECCVSYFQLLKKLAELDPMLKWTWFTPTRAPEKGILWPLLDLHTFFGPRQTCQAIRLSAVGAMASVMKYLDWSSLSVIAIPGDCTHDSIAQEDFDTQKAFRFWKWLPSLKTALAESFNIPSNLKIPEKKEEGVNRVAAVLVCVSKLAAANPYTELSLMHMLLDLVSSKKISPEIAIRAVELEVGNSHKLYRLYQSWIIPVWLHSKLKIESIPFQLFGYEKKELFLAAISKDVSVAMFSENDVKELDMFASSCRTNTSELVKRHFCAVFVGIIAVELRNVDAGPLSNFKGVQQLCSLVGGKSTLNIMVRSNITEILLQILPYLYDPGIYNNWVSDSVNKLRLPAFVHTPLSETTLLTAIHLISAESGYEGRTVIEELVMTSPKGVYDILLSLACSVHDAHTLYQRIWKLHHFVFFVQELTKAARTEKFWNEMKVYVTHFVVNSYLRFLNIRDSYDEGCCLSKAVLVNLKTFLGYLISFDEAELKRHIKPVIQKLAEISFPPDLEDSANEILQTLLVENGDKLSDILETLEPFPEDSRFHSSRISKTQKVKSLEDRLWICIKGIKDSNYTCSSERLKSLRHNLSHNKKEFGVLVESLKNKRFKDECEKDVIHNVIRVLVQLMNKNCNEEICAEAAKCLGEIGPIDLSTLVIPPLRTHFSVKDMSTVVSDVIRLVVTYLEDDDPVVVSATSTVLRNLLELEANEISEMNQENTLELEMMELLKPFVVPKTDQVRNTEFTLDSKEILAIQQKLLNGASTKYKDWVIQFTCALIGCVANDTFLHRIRPLCLLKVDFCEEIFPLVVYTLLALGKSCSLRKHLSSYFCKFFTNFVSSQTNQGILQNGPLMPKLRSIYQCKSALAVLLRCIQFLREHPVPSEFKGNTATNPWDWNFWLDINYLDAAKAAQYCGAHLTSILFLEIFALRCEASEEAELDEQSQESNREYLSTIECKLSDYRPELEKLFLQAYTKIGEPDGVYGCGFARYSDFESHIQHLESSQRWDQVHSALDSQGSNNEFGICKAMINLGRYNTCWKILKGSEAAAGQLDRSLTNIHYECGWRLSQWNVNEEKVEYFDSVIPTGDANDGTVFQKYVYGSIKHGIRSDTPQLDRFVSTSCRTVADDLRHSSLESSENLYGFLMRFQLIRVIEDLSVAHIEKSVHETCQKWKTQHELPCPDFKYQEPILTAMQVLLHGFQNKDSTTNDVSSDLNDILLDMIRKARDSGRLELAEKYVLKLSSVGDLKFRKELEVAKNHWNRGQDDIARHTLETLTESVGIKNRKLYPSLLLLHGEWKLLTAVDRPSGIFRNYLVQACKLYDSAPVDDKEKANAYKVVAEYADAQFRKLADNIQSQSFREKKTLLDKSSQECQERSKYVGADQEKRKNLYILQKKCAIDQEEIKNTYREKDVYQTTALKHYLKAIKWSNKYDLFIFRVIALWLGKLENSGKNMSEPATDLTVKEEKLPSHKYIPLVHQLSARLSKFKGSTFSLLEDILMKCAREHPYHTLPVLLTQAMLHADKQNGENPGMTGQELSTVASNILKKLKGDKLEHLSSKMSKLWKALINLAYHTDVQKGSASEIHKLSSKVELMQLKDMRDLPVPTLNLPIMPGGDYNNVTSIVTFKKEYQYVGGINSPKRISCAATDGQTYNMLLKGNDDLRQDAVMQQVFGVMNRLLETEPTTRRKRLLMRTYKVVPLSQRSGVIEWCENTQTFGEYLTGTGRDNKSGAHILYRPQDLTPYECRQKMIPKAKEVGDMKQKLNTYIEITDNFKPVFHHFFFENFKDSGTFFERRLAYTRSVATSSIVGYILGLGDRHCQNILIDKSTAECIHIDLGVAFEQGRILPTPETVPFRLTRDIVDGMGFSKTEGVFKISCENTLDVLRRNAEIILTILEVLLYDPLYLWTLTEDRKKKLQPDDSKTKGASRSMLSVDSNAHEDSSDQNNSAARELRRLRCKLAGIQEGATFGPTMTVSGHVTQLINIAQDPKNLACLFHGWQPYL